MPEVIRFYSVGDEYGCLSNFAPYPIRLGGKLWPTSEHYFQAQKFDWCWRCKKEHPMLDESEYATIDALFQQCLRVRVNMGPRRTHTVEEVLAEKFRLVLDAYAKMTGVRETNPNMILHHRVAAYGPPCPHCGKLLATALAMQCFVCGMDWHDPNNLVRRKRS